MVAAKTAKEAAAVVTGGVLAGLSEADIARLVAKGKQAEDMERTRSMGKKEKATIARAKKACLLNKAKKAGLTVTLEEAKAWIMAHPPTPKKTK